MIVVKPYNRTYLDLPKIQSRVREQDTEPTLNIHEAFTVLMRYLSKYVSSPDLVSYQVLDDGDYGYRIWWLDSNQQPLERIDLGRERCFGFIYDPDDPSRKPRFLQMCHPRISVEFFESLREE